MCPKIIEAKELQKRSNKELSLLQLRQELRAARATYRIAYRELTLAQRRYSRMAIELLKKKTAKKLSKRK